MPPPVSTGDRDAVLRQIRWCAVVQTQVNCHCQLGKSPVRNVEPMQSVVQYLTKAECHVVTCVAAFNTGCNLSITVLGAPARTATVILSRVNDGIDERGQRVRVQRPPDTSELTIDEVGRSSPRRHKRCDDRCSAPAKCPWQANERGCWRWQYQHLISAPG